MNTNSSWLLAMFCRVIAAVAAGAVLLYYYLQVLNHIDIAKPAEGPLPFAPLARRLCPSRPGLAGASTWVARPAGCRGSLPFSKTRPFSNYE
jgi:hypothetical protein